jgi:hypothetical protein
VSSRLARRGQKESRVRSAIDEEGRQCAAERRRRLVDGEHSLWEVMVPDPPSPSRPFGHWQSIEGAQPSRSACH